MLVVDTSVTAKWVIGGSETPEPDVAAALSLLPRGLFAPDLMLVEFANVLWKKTRRGEVLAQQARQSLAILPTLVTFLPSQPYVRRALEIGFGLDHPVYDCVFLALAEELGTVLVTADRRLLERLRGSEHAGLAADLGGRVDWSVP